MTLNPDQMIIANNATEFMRAMLVNPRVNEFDEGLAEIAVKHSVALHGQLSMAFGIPLPGFLSPSDKNA